MCHYAVERFTIGMIPLEDVFKVSLHRIGACLEWDMMAAGNIWGQTIRGMKGTFIYKGVYIAGGGHVACWCIWGRV